LGSLLTTRGRFTKDTYFLAGPFWLFPLVTALSLFPLLIAFDDLDKLGWSETLGAALVLGAVLGAELGVEE
jgi:hypothetical protein